MKTCKKCECSKPKALSNTSRIRERERERGVCTLPPKRASIGQETLSWRRAGPSSRTRRRRACAREKDFTISRGACLSPFKPGRRKEKRVSKRPLSRSLSCEHEHTSILTQRAKRRAVFFAKRQQRQAERETRLDLFLRRSRDARAFSRDERSVRKSLRIIFRAPPFCATGSRTSTTSRPKGSCVAMRPHA